MPVPLCRCRVLYIGSSVPTITKDGLQGIQQPLRERYPVNETTETKGIDSWLSVWSNGLLVEYIEGSKKTESAFYPINNLHYCAAVRYVNVTGFAIEGGGERFIPLDTPFANPPDSPHPPIFAAIFRRTTGVKVLECHAFICTNEKAANALVRCCFHSYADTISLKMEDKIPGLKAIKEGSRSATPSSDPNLSDAGRGEELGKDEANWNDRAIGQKTWQRRQQSGEYDSASLSFSIKNGTKKSKKNKNENSLVPFNARDTSEAGEIYEAGPGMYDRGYYMMPPHFMPPPGAHPGPPFRRGSAGSIPAPPGGFAAFRPPPPGMIPPPHMLPPQHMPPPYFMRPGPPPGVRMMPPPPHIAARMWGPMPPPHFMPPPPHPGARFMYPPPPFRHPFFGMPPSHMMDRPKTPNDGPIITSAESVYDTFPRGGIGNYEEPIYMPTNGGPPHSSYKPGSPDNQEGYYEVYRRFQNTDKKQVSRTDSDASNDDTPNYWDAYEARIYRQPHLNEKAFADSLAAGSPQAQAKKDNSPAPVDPGRKPEVPNGTARPDTPPADYDISDLHISEPQTKSNHQQQQRSAIF
uniref:PID domain-containing protein n=1 Tax=Panagrellus redivivus TaxID=6233 RepID=A0A7E4VKU2_PANRE